MPHNCAPVNGAAHYWEHLEEIPWGLLLHDDGAEFQDISKFSCWPDSREVKKKYLPVLGNQYSFCSPQGVCCLEEFVIVPLTRLVSMIHFMRFMFPIPVCMKATIVAGGECKLCPSHFNSSFAYGVGCMISGL